MSDIKSGKVSSTTTAWKAPPRFLFRKYSVYSGLKKIDDIKDFLDVGCGAGAMACALSQDLGLRGRGVDFSAKGIRSANNLKSRLGLKNVTFNKLDADKIPASYKSDLVTCFEVLEHVKDDKKLLKQLVNLSNKYVVISVPAKQRLFSQSDVLAGHYRRYEKAELINLLTQNGLSIISFTSYGYPYTNVIRLGRELVAKHKTTPENLNHEMEQRSKKSGTDLLDINRFFASKIMLLIKPMYHTSRLFNKLDLSEGYLVICEKTRLA